jgi:hypothetical protein
MRRGALASTGWPPQPPTFDAIPELTMTRLEVQGAYSIPRKKMSAVRLFFVGTRASSIIV